MTLTNGLFLRHTDPDGGETDIPVFPPNSGFGVRRTVTLACSGKSPAHQPLFAPTLHPGDVYVDDSGRALYNKAAVYGNACARVFFPAHDTKDAWACELTVLYAEDGWLHASLRYEGGLAFDQRLAQIADVL